MERIRGGATAAFQTRLHERLRDLLKSAQIDPQRLAQEAAILADRSDISEELARLKMHSAQLAALLDGGGEIGKKLDFLLQEMNRETNTILSKTSGAGEAGLKITELALECEGGDREDPGAVPESRMTTVFIISAPSGSGKSTLTRQLIERVPALRFSISYTTRTPRGQERDGHEYFFISREEFERARRRKANFWNMPRFSATITAPMRANWIARPARAWTWCSTSTSRVRDN